MRVSYDLDEATEDADVVMMLRVQLERQQRGAFPSIREYFRTFGLTPSASSAPRATSS